MTIEESINFVREYCSFEKDRAYILMAISRRKHNESVSNSEENIHRKIVTTDEEVEYNIKTLYGLMDRDNLNYRLYLTINARSITSSFFDFQQELASMSRSLFNGDEGTVTRIERLSSEWKSTLHNPSNRVEKNFLFDVDGSNEQKVKLINKISSETNVLLWRSSPNGYHVITEPFNYTSLDIDHLYDELDTDGMVHVDEIND